MEIYDKDKVLAYRNRIKDFIKHESTSGLLLILAAAIALTLNNSSLAWIYDGLLNTPMVIQIGAFEIAKPLLLWINDGLMAIFFFLIGLEVKREILVGELSSKERALLPIIAAIGGLAVPALIFYYFNQDNPEALRGWAVPTATDIAFALGVLALIGKNIPSSLKIMLLSIAIIDDIAAVLIIAIFYTAETSVISMGLAGIGLLVAIGFNMRGITRITPYILVGVFMWVCVLKSGVHATIAGVLIALTIPLSAKDKSKSPLETLEHMLHPWVAYFIMPIFAFANAGVALGGVTLAMLTTSLPLGIMAGLFAGKQIGVFVFTAIAVALGICKLPNDLTWRHIYGLSLLCGIGFTMSLFIGTLAFDDPALNAQVRISVLIASTVSALLGFMVLKFAKQKNA